MGGGGGEGGVGGVGGGRSSCRVLAASSMSSMHGRGSGRWWRIGGGGGRCGGGSGLVEVVITGEEGKQNCPLSGISGHTHYRIY